MYFIMTEYQSIFCTILYHIIKLMSRFVTARLYNRLNSVKSPAVLYLIGLYIATVLQIQSLGYNSDTSVVTK